MTVPAAVTGAVTGDADLIGLMFAAFGSEHTGFEIAQIAHWFAAEHHGYHNDQQYRCGERNTRRHDADKSLRRHFGAL